VTPEPTTPAESDFVGLLRERRLTPAQRRIARYLLDHPLEAGTLGSAELATRTNVSQPSVSRFAQALGFTGYPALRRYLATRLVDRGASVGAPAPSRFLQALDAEVANLQSLTGSDQEATLAAAGTRLAASPAIVVLGLRASAPLAAYIAFFARKLHPHVRLVTDSGSCAADELREASDAGADMLVCLALPRCPRETVTAFEVSQDLGFDAVTLTDHRLRPIAQRSTFALTARVGSELVFDSQAAPMLLAAGLLDAMAEAAPTRTQRRLEAFESMAAERAYFDPA
jgi:DNA-binding MurR/RpiR family transcriptional regulator